MPQRLVRVRGETEALAAARGGGFIEYSGSTFGTPYPLNIMAVREKLDQSGFQCVPISTNIGADQRIRSTVWQAALGVGMPGADFAKCGLTVLDPKAAENLGRNIIRGIREWFPGKKVYPAVVPESLFENYWLRYHSP